MKYSDETVQQQIDRIYRESQQERKRLLSELEAAKATRPTISEARVREIAEGYLAKSLISAHGDTFYEAAICQALREAGVEVTP